MMLSNLQNAFQTLSYVKHTMCLWGSSSGYFIVRKRAFRETKPFSWSWSSHHCLPAPHPGPFAPHSTPLPLQRQVARHTGPWGSVDTAELHLCTPGATETQGTRLHLNVAPNRSTLLYKPFPHTLNWQRQGFVMLLQRASFQQLTVF